MAQKIIYTKEDYGNNPSVCTKEEHESYEATIDVGLSGDFKTSDTGEISKQASRYLRFLELADESGIRKAARFVLTKDDHVVYYPIYHASKKINFFEKADAEAIGSRALELFGRRCESVRAGEKDPSWGYGGGEEDFYDEMGHLAVTAANCSNSFSDKTGEKFANILNDPFIEKCMLFGLSQASSTERQHVLNQNEFLKSLYDRKLPGLGLAENMHSSTDQHKAHVNITELIVQERQQSIYDRKLPGLRPAQNMHRSADQHKAHVNLTELIVQEKSFLNRFLARCQRGLQRIGLLSRVRNNNSPKQGSRILKIEFPKSNYKFQNTVVNEVKKRIDISQANTTGRQMTEKRSDLLRSREAERGDGKNLSI